MLTLDFSDKPVSYATFVRDVASEVVRQLKEQRDEPEMISQNKAYTMFGRGNVDRWRRQGKVHPCKRPGKIEYFVAELRKAQQRQQDYFDL